MGRLAVTLDPEGYSYATEPGVSFQITGAQLVERLGQTESGALSSPLSGFWNPPGSEWLLPRPRQFSPDWPRNELVFDQYLLAKDSWIFPAEITAVEWAPLKLPDGTTFPQNKWVSAYVPEDVTGLDATSYSALATAAGVEFPSGMATIAIASSAPNGDLLNDQWDHAPWFSWVQSPAPRDTLVFGWADFALVFAGTTVTLCRTPNNDQQTWEKLGSWNQEAQSARFLPPVTDTFQHNLFDVQVVRAQTLAVAAIPVGWQDLYLTFGKGPAQPVPLRKATEANRWERLFKSGAWWIGAAPGQTVNFQAQIIGYGDAADTTERERPLFDLGANYSPTLAPEVDVEFRMDVTAESDITESDASGISNLIESGGDPAEEIEYTLTDENGDPWASDGTHHKAHFSLRLSPTAAGPTYLAPQFRRLVLRFPPKLEARTADPLTLNDTQWYRCGAESSLDEPLGKRVFVDLWDAGAERLSASGHDLRDWYPVEIREDTGNDGTYATLRAAGWIDQPELTLHHETHATTGKPVQFYRLRGRGLLCRGDQSFELLPELVDALGDGYVEHKEAVRQAIQSCGIDTDDADFYAAAADPNAGTDLSRLPGTWKREAGVLANRIDSPYGPTWEETRVAYAQRVAEEVVGWKLYEGLGGIVRYHPDLQVMLQQHFKYHVSATLYRTQAAAAGAGVPGQYYEPEPIRGNTPPAANVIRVVGKADDTSLTPTVIERDEAGISDPSDEDWIGERRVKGLAPKFAVNLDVMRMICRLALLRLGRRRVTWSVTIPKLAPWQLSSPIDVGHVVTLQGRGDWLVIHVEAECYKSSAAGALFRTRLTVERLPAVATASGSAGDYPGSGA